MLALLLLAPPSASGNGNVCDNSTRIISRVGSIGISPWTVALTRSIIAQYGHWLQYCPSTSTRRTTRTGCRYHLGTITRISLKFSKFDWDHMTWWENRNRPRGHHSDDFDPTPRTMDIDPLDDNDCLSVSLSLDSIAKTRISWKSSEIDSVHIACWENWNPPRGRRIDDFDPSTPELIFLATHSDNDQLDNIDGLSMSLGSTTTRISLQSSKIDSDHIARSENGSPFDPTPGTMIFVPPHEVDLMGDVDCLSLSLCSTATGFSMKSSMTDPDHIACGENWNQPLDHHIDDFDPTPLSMMLATPADNNPLDDVDSLSLWNR